MKSLAPYQSRFDIISLLGTHTEDTKGVPMSLFHFCRKPLQYGCLLDNLIRKKSQDPIGLQRQGVIVNYIPKFQVATMSLEVA